MSVTKQLTIEIELLRVAIQIKKMIRNNAILNINERKYIVYLQGDSLFSQCITALPDILEILTDSVILEASHQHLRLHSPQ